MRDDQTITDGADAELDNHSFYRDGSFWVCRHRCGVQVPFPSPMPDSATLGPCTPRRYGDSAPVVTERLPRVYIRADGGPCAIDNACPKCGAVPGDRCSDGRRVNGTTMRPHRERA